MHTSPGATLARLRASPPLVHCITNPVAANLTANALICLGAAPLMAEAAEEAEEAALAADALLVNLGMQTPSRMAAARIAAAASRLWVLDPVAAGALPGRTALGRDFLALRPAVIKGNASEILGLAGAGGGRGTDARHAPEAAVEAAQALGRQGGAVIAVTGAADLVTDGTRQLRIARGHPMMARVSALGCVVGAIAAACLAAEPDRLLATGHALHLLGVAGERAATQAAGLGSFPAALLDALAALDPADPALDAL